MSPSTGIPTGSRWLVLAALVAALGLLAVVAAAAPVAPAVAPVPQAFDLLNDSDGWLLQAGRLYFTHNAGVTWQERTPPVPAGGHLRAAALTSDGAGWLVAAAPAEAPAGHVAFTLARTADFGRTWRFDPAPLFTAADPSYLASPVYLALANADHAWVLVQQPSSAAFRHGDLFATQDGQAWAALPTPPRAGPVRFTSPTAGWLAGEDVLYQTRDGGATWQPVLLAADLAGASPSVQLPVFSGSLGLAVTTYADAAGNRRVRLSASTDAGATWAPAGDSPGGPSLGAGVALPLAAWGAQGPEAALPTGRWQAPSTWAPQPGQPSPQSQAAARSVPPGLQQVDTGSARTGWALAVTGDCAAGPCTQQPSLLLSTDAGATWAPLTLPSLEAGSTDITDMDIYPAVQSVSSVDQVLPSRTTVFIGQGFDSCTLPSLSQLQTWMSASPYRVWNLYLGGAARASFCGALSPGHISGMAAQGWKMIPTWVGPQSACWNGGASIPRIPADPSAAYTQGIIEADAALAAAASLGLTDGAGASSILYYDLEAYFRADTAQLNACRESAKALVSGWTQRLHARGNLAGVYGSPSFSYVADLAGLPEPPDALWGAHWIAAWPLYNPDATVWNVGSLPNSLWARNQRLRQYIGDHNETWGGVTLNIDSNVLEGIVAALPGPVAPTPTATSRPNVAVPTAGPGPAAGAWRQVFFDSAVPKTECGSRTDTAVYFLADTATGWVPPVGCPAPGAPWSAEIERTLNFEAGTYTFTLLADDSARLYIDGHLRLDTWQGAPQTETSLALSAGSHAVRVTYANTGGAGSLHLWWRGPGALPYQAESQRDPYQWWASYWANLSQTGPVAAQRNEGTGSLVREWGSGSPGFGLPADQFSTRFERTVYLACGTYRFSLSADDGTRVWLDGAVVPAFDRWSAGVWNLSADLSLLAGEHTLRVDQFEQGGDARIQLGWELLAACAGGTPGAPATEPPAVAACPATIAGWKAEFWPNERFAGPPTVCRDDASLSFSWGAGAPDPAIPPDGFTAAWTRVINFAAGTYQFNLAHDDGARLTIDGVLVLDRWCETCSATDRVIRTFSSSGARRVTVEYRERAGHAGVDLSWFSVPPATPPATATTNPSLPATPVPPATVVAPAACPAISGWKGEYWNNTRLAGPAVLCRNHSELRFTWGSAGPGPGVNVDGFSARFTRLVSFSGGNTTFRLSHDDGARLYIDDVLVYENACPACSVAGSVTVPLSPGAHTLRLETWDNTGWAGVSLDWANGVALYLPVVGR